MADSGRDFGDRSEELFPASSRKFYDIPESGNIEHNGEEVPTSRQNESESCSTIIVGERGKKNLLSYIEQNVIGRDKTFSGPFGLREVVYCDYVASGRSLRFIEDYIQTEVLPEYGNTHTTTTVTSLQTTLFRHEARDIIRNAVHASEHDAVIFTGAGTTAAVHKLIQAQNYSPQNPPVLFTGPDSHHSSFLPWYEVGATVVRINGEADTGLVDLDHLRAELQKWGVTSRPLVGLFTAASNVTGLLTDVTAVTVTLHRHGALAFWDYATAAPYVEVDMNPVVASADQAYVYKDAVMMSPHKFVGGVGTPGLLIAKKALFKNPTPADCGGGTVFFVRRRGHRYLREVEMREEGGTPAIVESIRAGLCFQLKQAVTSQVIMERERYYCKLALSRWSSCPNLVILGNNVSSDRLPIFSFLIRHAPSGQFLHHNFVSSLLNDMFGIQTRGGCACAGPYAQDLLGLDEETAERIENLLVEDGRLDRTHLRRYREYSDKEILRPGFSRLNLPYFMSEEDVTFVLEAVAIVAEHGWKMLPQYIFNPETGEWRHWRHQVFKDRKWLGHVTYTSGQMTYQEPKFTPKGDLPSGRQDTLERSRKMFEQILKFRVELADQRLMFTGEADALRWFLLPSEAWDCLRGKPCQARDMPFSPGNPVSRVDYKHPDYHKLPPQKHNAAAEPEPKPEPETVQTESEESSVPFPDGMQTILDRGFVAKGEVLRGVSEEDKKQFGGQITRNEKHAASNNVSAEKQANASTRLDDVTADSDSAKVAIVSSTKPSEPSNSGAMEKSQKSSQVKAKQNCDKVEFSRSCVRPRDHVTKSDHVTSNEAEREVSNVKWESPSKKLFHDTVEAIEQYSMISDGDRILVCLSGGKDSLSLLHALHQYQFYAGKKDVKFTLGAVTVDPKTASYDPSPLKAYLKALGVPYLYEEQAILEQAANLPYECASICSFCSRMKRGRIYAAARREGYNVLAMGHHLDDLAESLLMNTFHNGCLRTMKARYAVKEGDLKVIRPLCNVREKELREFAEEEPLRRIFSQRKLPVIAENCPACFEAPKERHRMKQLLANQELLFPRLFASVRAAMAPLVAIDRAGVSIQQAVGEFLRGKGEEAVEVEEDE